jgi:predicted nucleotidyltransferase
MEGKIQQILDDIAFRLERDYKPERAILYGSYAYGTPNADSDIDLFIVKETDAKPVDRIVEVMRLLFTPGRDVSVEPLVYTPGELSERLARRDPFLTEILERGRVIYERS